MYNIHTYRKRNSLKASAAQKTASERKNANKKSSQAENQHHSTLIDETYPYTKNPLIQAINSKDLDVDEIYDCLQHRKRHHKKLDVKPIRYSSMGGGRKDLASESQQNTNRVTTSSRRPQSASAAASRQASRTHKGSGAPSSSTSRKRPRSAVATYKSPSSVVKNASSSVEGSVRSSSVASSNRPSVVRNPTNTSKSSSVRARPQSAIERSLRRPSSALTTGRVALDTSSAAHISSSPTTQFVRPRSASLVRGGASQGFSSPTRRKKRPQSAVASRSSRHLTRSGLDLRRPSSAYQAQSASQRIIHVLPMEMRDEEQQNEEFYQEDDYSEAAYDTNQPQIDDDVLQAMESVAEDCLQNYEYGKDSQQKWTLGRRGKYKNENYIEWSGTEQERQEAYERELKEIAWQQAQEEKMEKDAIKYIEVKERYRKQRALFKSQQQRNMIKSVVLVKEPRTVKQLEKYLKEPTRLGGTRRPQSAVAYSSGRHRKSTASASSRPSSAMSSRGSMIYNDENMPPSSRNHSGATKGPSQQQRRTRRRPNSARPASTFKKSNHMEWEEDNIQRNPRKELSMLDKFEARQRLEEEALEDQQNNDAFGYVEEAA